MVMPAHHTDTESPPIDPRPPTAGQHEGRGMSATTHGLGDTSGYVIRTKGRLDERWTDWFEGADLSHDPDGTTVIRCPAMDQAGLHGLLRTLRDMGLPLISISPIEPERPSDTDHDPDH
jgi:hypothetical protein